MLAFSFGSIGGKLSAASFDCQKTNFCWTNQYEHHAGCSKDIRALTIKTNRRFAYLDEGHGTLRFNKVRPYFTPLNWYQLTSKEKGVLNLMLDDILVEPDFSLEQMPHGEVNYPIWRIVGNCERKKN